MCFSKSAIQVIVKLHPIILVFICVYSTPSPACHLPSWCQCACFKMLFKVLPLKTECAETHAQKQIMNLLWKFRQKGQTLIARNTRRLDSIYCQFCLLPALLWVLVSATSNAVNYSISHDWFNGLDELESSFTLVMTAWGQMHCCAGYLPQSLAASIKKKNCWTTIDWLYISRMCKLIESVFMPFSPIFYQDNQLHNESESGSPNN